LKQNRSKLRLQWARVTPKLGLQSLLINNLQKLKKAAEEDATEQSLPKKSVTPTPEVLKENIEYIICHASGKKLSKEEEREAQHYAQKLKYPKGALVFNGRGEEDFLYCLLDSKEISIC
jgi:hypothetical protein